MYPRNAASPEPIAIGAVVQITDGAVQSSGVTVRVKAVGQSEADGGGTTAYSTDGVVLYTPTQAETNHTSFVLIAKKTGCIPASVTVVTSASATAGYAGVDWAKVTGATTTVNLSGTTISTSQAVASVSGAVGSVTGAVGSVTSRVTANTDQWGGVAVTGMPMPTYAQPTGFLAATFPGTVSSFAGGAVASVTGAVGSVTGNVGGNVSGSVGSISGVTFPTNFASLGINSSGHVLRVVLVDTTTANTDMRGTDNALLAASYTAPDNATIGVISTNLGTVNTNVLSRLAATSYVAPLSGGETAAAVWNALLASYTTAGSFGARVVRSVNSDNELQLTGSHHAAAVLHDAEPDSIPADALTAAAIAAIQAGLATSANQTVIIDRVTYGLTALVGACSDAQTAAETYTLTIGGSTYTVDYSGLDSSGNRSTTTLSKV